MQVGDPCARWARGRGLRQEVRVESMGRVNLEVLGARWFGELKDVIRYDVSTYFEREEVDGTKNQAT